MDFYLTFYNVVCTKQGPKSGLSAGELNFLRLGLDWKVNKIFLQNLKYILSRKSYTQRLIQKYF